MSCIVTLGRKLSKRRRRSRSETLSLLTLFSRKAARISEFNGKEVDCDSEIASRNGLEQFLDNEEAAAGTEPSPRRVNFDDAPRAALVQAIYYNDVKFISWVLANVDISFNPLLHEALEDIVRNNKTEILKVFIQSDRIDPSQNGRNDAIKLAAKSARFYAVRLLLQDRRVQCSMRFEEAPSLAKHAFGVMMQSCLENASKALAAVSYLSGQESAPVELVSKIVAMAFGRNLTIISSENEQNAECLVSLLLEK